MTMDVEQAQKQIAQILAELERETDQVVEGLSIEAIDVTAVGSHRQQLMRWVRIDLKPVPGSNWQM